MKRNAGRRTTRKITRHVQPLLPIPEARAHLEEVMGRAVPGKVSWSFDGKGRLTYRKTTEVRGVALPPDLEERCRDRGETDAQLLAVIFGGGGHLAGKNANDAVTMLREHEDLLAQWIADAAHFGFRLALARYADDLKHVPEAAAMLESRRLAAKKGGAARRDKAAPTHKAICKRFRELRKTVPKKTARYLRIAGEVGMSERQIQRIISEKGLD